MTQMILKNVQTLSSFGIAYPDICVIGTSNNHVAMDLGISNLGSMATGNAV